MARLQRDLPTYIAAAYGVSNGGVFTKIILSWRRSHASEVGAWSEAARFFLAMALNSAGAERVFSLLEILFRSNQDTALFNYIRGSIMLRYNKTKRTNEGSKIKLSSAGNVLKRQKKKTKKWLENGQKCTKNVQKWPENKQYETSISIDHTAHFARNGRKMALNSRINETKMALLKRKAR
jgi:hypothetical protein